jgi:phosphopantetheine adenylyltransferase/dephospho-CoA kinase
MGLQFTGIPTAFGVLGPRAVFLAFDLLIAPEHILQKIGLTGGIASGKTTVTSFFRDHQVPVIDADILGHRTYEPGSDTHAQVAKAFGDDVVAADGTIDRRVLGGKVFGKPEELKRLTDIVWPGIRKLAGEDLSELEVAGNQLAVLEAAVLFEAGWEDLVDEIWVVVVDPDIAVQRLKTRNNLDEEAARARLASQLTNAERIAKASIVIENNFTLEALSARIQQENDALQARLQQSAGR